MACKYLLKDQYFKLGLSLVHIYSSDTFAGNNHFYNYFAKAGWMSSSHLSRENYVLHSDGKVSVKKSGLYIVHASVSIFTYYKTSASLKF